MSDYESHKVDYILMVINAYARSKAISQKEAFFQLRDCGGMDALDEFYDIEHTLPLSTTVNDLAVLYARRTA